MARLQLMPDDIPLAGESPSELFERMTVMMLQKLTDEIEALKRRVAYLEGVHQP